MTKLNLPAHVRQEFATVEALLLSSATTRCVDALVLAWIKYEKQLRRLFCFLIFQHPALRNEQIDEIVSILASERELYPSIFIVGIAKLGVTSVADLLGDRHQELSEQIERISLYRNKLVHGQITGQGIKSTQLERDVLWIIDWIATLGREANVHFGYNGLRRNTYRSAKAAAKIAVRDYPFETPEEFKSWLRAVCKEVKRKRSNPKPPSASPRL